jgi:hypothetical protein
VCVTCAITYYYICMGVCAHLLVCQDLVRRTRKNNTYKQLLHLQVISAPVGRVSCTLDSVSWLVIFLPDASDMLHRRRDYKGSTFSNC